MSYTDDYKLQCQEAFNERKNMFVDFLTMDLEEAIKKYTPEKLDEYYDFDFGSIEFVSSYSVFGNPTEHKPLISGFEINQTFNKDLLDDLSCYAEMVVNQNPTVKLFIGSKGDAWISAEELGAISVMERIVLPDNDNFSNSFYYDALDCLYHAYDKNHNVTSSLQANIWNKTDEDIDRLSAIKFESELPYSSFKEVLYDRLDFSALSVVDRNAFLMHFESSGYDFKTAAELTISGKDYDGVKNDTYDGSFRVVQKKEVIDDFIELRKQIDDLFDDVEFSNIAEHFDVDCHKASELDDKKLKFPEEKQKEKVRSKFKP
jgi:hypothetical protein